MTINRENLEREFEELKKIELPPGVALSSLFPAIFAFLEETLAGPADLSRYPIREEIIVDEPIRWYEEPESWMWQTDEDSLGNAFQMSLYDIGDHDAPLISEANTYLGRAFELEYGGYGYELADSEDLEPGFKSLHDAADALLLILVGRHRK